MEMAAAKTFDAGDVDRDLSFTFAITVVLDLGSGDTVHIAPVISFKPVPNGFKGSILHRNPDGSLKPIYRFEIHDDVGWDAAVALCADACELMLSFDPFTAEGRDTPIGFDISPAARR
jgi:hypothetical protein